MHLGFIGLVLLLAGRTTEADGLMIEMVKNGHLYTNGVRGNVAENPFSFAGYDAHTADTLYAYRKLNKKGRKPPLISGELRA